MATADPSTIRTVDIRRRDLVQAATGEDALVAVADAAAPPPNAGGRDYWPIVKTLIGRAIMMYLITQFLGNRGKQVPAPTTSVTTAPDGTQIIVTYGQNVYGHLMPMDMYAYVNERPKYHRFDDENLVWREEGLQYGDWTSGPNHDGTYTFSAELPLSENVQNNKSNVYLHVYFVRAGDSPRPTDPNYNAGFTVHKTYQLNKLKKVTIGPKKQNLLTGETSNPRASAAVESTDSTPPQPSVIMSHWHPNLTFNLVDDHTAWTKGKAPSPIGENLEFNSEGNYLPILYFNDYWNLNKEYKPINDTTKVVNLTLTYHPLSLFRWQLYVSQAQSNKWSKMLNGDIFQSDSGNENLLTEDSDTIKEALLDTNPILLGLTVVVSLFHTVFEFMAFKNDIQFWKNKGEDLEGLSVRSVFLNVVQSLIVLLYVLDNDTNPMVKFSIAIGLAIEIWKVKKVMNVRVDYENKVLGLFPRVWLEDKKSYVESSTRKYDKLAFRYLSWAFFPLVMAYGIYSLLYEEHKGWYSWVLGMMYGFLLTFGFISMTPQLFINYKLKSVAHLPWRMMTYKALNTFIDDIFAFVIKMPTMYRIGCLRDDVIFFIFLYQRWIYRVDPNRVNEYGYSQEMLNRGGAVPLEQQTPEIAEALGDNETAQPPSSESSGSVPSDVEVVDMSETVETKHADVDQSVVRKRKSKGSRARKEE